MIAAIHAHEATASILSDLCDAFVTNEYLAFELVFEMDKLAELMRITIKGKYILHMDTLSPTDPQDADHCVFSSRTCFSDVALFANVSHGSSLLATTIGEALAVAGVRLRDSLSSQPIWLEFARQFAIQYLNSVHLDVHAKTMQRVYDYQPSSLARE